MSSNRRTRLNRSLGSVDASSTYLIGVVSDTAPVGLPANGVWITKRTDTTPPTVPAGLTAVSAGNGIALSWTASTDDSGAIGGYKIYRGGVFLANSSTITYTDTTAASGSSYSYTVSAYDPFGNESSVSSSASATYQSTIFPASGKITEYVVADLALSNNAAATTLANRVSGGVALVSGDGISGHTSSPTYRTDLATQPVIVFDGVDDFMGDGATGATAQPSTRIFLGRFIVTGASKVLVSTRISGSNRNVIAQNVSTKWNAYAGTNLPHTLSTDGTSLHFFGVVFNGTSSIIYIDGTAVTGSAGTEAGNGVRIAAPSSVTATLPATFTNMAFGEMAIYSRALTTSELDAIRTSAKAKWSDLP